MMRGSGMIHPEAFRAISAASLAPAEAAAGASMMDAVTPALERAHDAYAARGADPHALVAPPPASVNHPLLAAASGAGRSSGGRASAPSSPSSAAPPDEDDADDGISAGELFTHALIVMQSLAFWSPEYRRLPSALRAAIAEQIADVISELPRKQLEKPIPPEIIADIFEVYDFAGLAREHSVPFIDLRTSSSHDGVEALLARAAEGVLEQLTAVQDGALDHLGNKAAETIAIELIVQAARRDLQVAGDGARRGRLSAVSVDASLRRQGIFARQEEEISAYDGFERIYGENAGGGARFLRLIEERVASVEQQFPQHPALRRLPLKHQRALARDLVLSSLLPSFARGKGYVRAGMISKRGVAEVFERHAIPRRHACDVQVAWTLASAQRLLENTFGMFVQDLEAFSDAAEIALTEEALERHRGLRNSLAFTRLLEARAERSFAAVSPENTLFLWSVAKRVAEELRLLPSDYLVIGRHRASFTALARALSKEPRALQAWLFENAQRVEEIALEWDRVTNSLSLEEYIAQHVR